MKFSDHASGSGLFLIDKFEVGAPHPYESVEAHNLFVYAGVSVIWEALIGRSVLAFNNANAAIGSGDSTTAADPTQTDLQAFPNKIRKAMNGPTYPAHSAGTGGSASTVQFQSLFSSVDANWYWNEVAVFNSQPYGGQMLDRAVSPIGQKTHLEVWLVTATLTIG